MDGRESTKPLKHFAVPINTIEKRTGIDFFEALDSNVENKLESQVKTNEWAF